MESEAALYQRDPQAWEEYLAQGNAKQARKRVSADAGFVRHLRPHLFVTVDRTPIPGRLLFVSSDRTQGACGRRPLTSADAPPLLGANGPGPVSAVTSGEHRTRLRGRDCGPNSRTTAVQTNEQSQDALIRDETSRILLVDPGYKPGWDMPGGMAEANESPMACVRRELLEELGLDITPAQLLCVEWVPPHGPWDDLLAFVFSAGTLSVQQAAGIQLLDGELERYEFCDKSQAEDRLNERTWRRLKAALRAVRDGTVAYLQDGQPAGS